MDIFLTVLAAILILAGAAGCFIPVLIGPPLGFAGILCLHFTSFGHFSVVTLVALGALALVASILDNLLPMFGARKFGGSKRAVTGAAVGTLLGMFFMPPFGLLLGAFVGALVAELTGGRTTRESLKASLGTFLGFITGVAFKVFVSGLMIMTFALKMIPFVLKSMKH
jgi:uncharacterized protein YqgC (DUF456 family)